MLQRGPGLLAQDTILLGYLLINRQSGFKEAQAFWPRIRGQLSTCIPRLVGFKEAQAFWPRILIPNPIIPPSFHRLQRGPGLLAQDTYRREIEKSSGITGFKEAQAFWPRIRGQPGNTSSFQWLLQRGPGLLAQDTPAGTRHLP